MAQRPGFWGNDVKFKSLRTISLSAALTLLVVPLGFAQGLVGVSSYYKVVDAGHSVKISSFASLHPDCTSLGRTDVNLVEAPRGGEVATKVGTDYPTYPLTNPRVSCIRHRVPSTLVIYQAAAGYAGPDTFVIEVVFPEGVARRYR